MTTVDQVSEKPERIRSINLQEFGITREVPSATGIEQRGILPDTTCCVNAQQLHRRNHHDKQHPPAHDTDDQNHRFGYLTSSRCAVSPKRIHISSAYTDGTIPLTESTSTGFPPELTNFIGRRREVEETRRRMGSSRLVTVAGPGGIGKTRLALRVAEKVRRTFHDGICLIELDSASGNNLGKLNCSKITDSRSIALLAD